MEELAKKIENVVPMMRALMTNEQIISCFKTAFKEYGIEKFSFEELSKERLRVSWRQCNKIFELEF